jgi:hypothetical protein
MPMEHPERENSSDEADAPEGQQAAEGGAESYGGDPDAEPSVTEEEIERGNKRDQAEG